MNTCIRDWKMGTEWKSLCLLQMICKFSPFIKKIKSSLYVFGAKTLMFLCHVIRYDVMMECWRARPILRPSFTELVERLGSMLEESVRKVTTTIFFLSKLIVRFTSGILFILSSFLTALC